MLDRKEARYMGAKELKQKRPHELNFYLTIPTESQLYLLISEADGYEKWLTYENVKRRRSWSSQVQKYLSHKYNYRNVWLLSSKKVQIEL